MRLVTIGAVGTYTNPGYEVGASRNDPGQTYDYQLTSREADRPRGITGARREETNGKKMNAKAIALGTALILIGIFLPSGDKKKRAS